MLQFVFFTLEVVVHISFIGRELLRFNEHEHNYSTPHSHTQTNTHRALNSFPIQPISPWVQIVASCGCNYSLQNILGYQFQQRPRPLVVWVHEEEEGGEAAGCLLCPWRSLFVTSACRVAESHRVTSAHTVHPSVLRPWNVVVLQSALSEATHFLWLASVFELLSS